MAQADSIRMEAFPVYWFGQFRLDTARGALTRSGRSIRIRPKSFEVLRYLVEHSGRLISKDELIEAVWSPAVVTDGALTQCLIDIRRALGSDGGDLIETVPRRGYLLRAEVIVEEPGCAVPDSRPRRRWLILTGWGSVVVVMVAAAWWWSRPVAGPATAAPLSIAVMPFTDISPGGDQAYLSDGLAEDVLTLLARSPGLRVTARTSSFLLRSETLDAPAVARRLGVAFVLEGSVRRWGDRLRVTAQLIEAEAGIHRWSEAYDRQGLDALELGLEIAAAVAQALRVELAPGQQQVDIDRGAYALYLQARHVRFQGRGAEMKHLEQAEALLERSVAIDPNFADAYVQLASVYGDMDSVEGLSAVGDIRWTRIEDMVEKARSIDPYNIGVSLLSGSIAWRRDQDWATAVRHFERALELGPGIPIYDVVPMLLELNQVDEAITYGEYVTIHDPLCAFCFEMLATAYLLAERLGDAQKAIEQALLLQPGWTYPRVIAAEIQTRSGDPAGGLTWLETLEPDDPSRMWGGSIFLHRLGRYEEFEAALEAFRSRWGDTMPDGVAHIYARVGDLENAFLWLDKIDTRIARRVASYHDFYWSELADDPRWRAFQTKWGVAPSQLAAHRMNITIPAQ
jgi:TolB-like protein/DNA-binding winged helix-turn-helix (wHTH) protein